MRAITAVKLNRSIRDWKGAAKIWNELLFKEYIALGRQELKPAPCIFLENGMIVIRYVDGLAVLVKNGKYIDPLKGKLE